MSLRDYQQLAVDAALNFVYTGNPEKPFSGKKGHPLILMPTGVGKSHVIAGLIQQAIQHYPRMRFLKATHVKKLIQQNAEKLMKLWPGVPLGIHSAGLKQKDLVHPIIFGGIHTMINKAAMFGHRDFFIIDEAHLLSPEENTMYQRLIKTLMMINPDLVVIGLTATGFRLGQGRLTNDGLFTDVAIDLTDVVNFNRFIEEGYLIPLVPKRTQTQLDISSVGISKGELKQDQLQKAVDKYEVTVAALQEAIAAGQYRRKWLCFASGIEHAEHIAQILSEFGFPSYAVHSKRSETENDEIIAAHGRGEFCCLVNYKMLTTGYDDPQIDFIIDLYPTVSPGLHVQKYGRGTRPDYAPGFDLSTREGRLNAIQASYKHDCLVMDFGGNTARLGPINDPRIPKKKGEGGGDAPVKLCPHSDCGAYNHASARHCIGCGREFVFAVKFNAQAATDEILKTDVEPIVETFDVLRVEYLHHQKAGSTPAIRVVYHTFVQRFQEFVNFESPIGYAKHLAHEWFRQRYPLKEGETIPQTTAEVLNLVSSLRTPKKIRVWVNNKPHPKILNHEY